MLVSAQESAELRLAYPDPAMAHDEQSLATIAANSAEASRTRVHELLGRNDVQVSCVCPMRLRVRAGACLCLAVLLIFLFENILMPGIAGLRKNATR